MKNTEELFRNKFKTNYRFMAFFGLMLAILLTANSGRLLAQHRDSTAHFARHPGPGHAGIPNLTPDQQKKMESMRLTLSKEILPISNELAEKRAHLRTLQTAGKADLKAINSTIDEISQLQAQLMKKRAAHVESIRQILTDDQRVAFDTRHAMMKGRMNRFHGRQGGHRSHRS